MLIVRSTFAKMLPDSMHARWDTWASVWLSSSAMPGIVAGAGVFIIHAAKYSDLQGALGSAGILGVHACAVAWNKRNRKEWTLPQHEWRDACTKVEDKIRGIVHMPHLYRMGALCDLSSVLKDIDAQRAVASVKQLNGLGLQNDDIISMALMEGYTNGNVSAMMLTPENLHALHNTLEFNEKDVEQWVEASYIQRIHSDLHQPMPGTIDALANMADNNPASMAFHLQKNCAYAQRNKMHAGYFSVQWKDEKSAVLFKKTQWPQMLDLMHEAHAKTDVVKTPAPSALDLYREVMATRQVQALLSLDGNVFSMD